jgi:nucleoside-diphosphate kinase
MTDIQTTFIAVKPDAVQRGLIGEIIGRFEKRGLKVVGIKFLQITREMAEKHYAEHKGKPFFEGLVSFITSGPVVAMAWEGKNAVQLARNTLGATNPNAAAPGTIRGDLAIDMGRNVVHASDSPESAARELSIFFTEKELLQGWSRSNDPWIVE